MREKERERHHGLYIVMEKNMFQDPMLQDQHFIEHFEKKIQGLWQHSGLASTVKQCRKTETRPHTF